VGAGSYRYRVRACNACGCSDPCTGDHDCVVTLPPPVPCPIDYPTSDCDRIYTVSWTASSGATCYQLERSKDGNYYNNVYTGPLTSYNESGLGNGSYCYRVKACNDSGCSCCCCSDWCTGTWDCNENQPPEPNTLTVPANDGDGAYTVSWTASAGATSYQLESSAPASGTSIYPLWVQVYSGTALSYNEKVGGGTWSYRVKACNDLLGCCSAWTPGGNNCVVSDCLKSTATEYAVWKTWRYPRCWCFPRQCRGDINGLKVGVNWIQTTDLAYFKLAYLKNDAVVATVICSTGATGTIRGICADLNHAKVGVNRVQSTDLSIFKTYYLKGEAIVTCCDTAAPAADCVLVSGDKYNFWTGPY
jgi:hypothetical protein